MSTISGLLLRQPEFQPYDLGRTLTQATNIQGGHLSNQTRLLELAALRQQQAAEEEMMTAIQRDPALAQQLFGGGSVLGALGPATGGPPGAITQAPLGGGPAQTVPAYPDASRYAQVPPTGGGPLPAGVGMPTVTPPQSTLASLGPQPQQNPLLAMAQRDPRAALMLEQRMQQQQAQQFAMDEKRLDMGVKISEAVARQLQGVTDQASLDEARERIRLIHPQAAAQMPQFYSKEAVEAIQQRGIAVADVARWRKDMATAQQTRMQTRMQTELLPGLFKDMGAFGTGGVPAPSADTANGATPPAGRQTGAGPGTANLSPAFRTKADSIADRLGANREDFYRVMSFETGGEMSPATRNRAGSGATGLIQFMPDTAKQLGTTTDALAKMTPEQQLDYVAQYLTPYKGKIGTLKDLYMAVLYPAAVGKSEDTVLFSPEKTPAAYRQNAALDTGKKGYVTVGDAVAAVERTTGGSSGTGAGGRGGTSTAQAPPPNPRVAQLQAQIDQGNQAALKAEAVGMEGPARQIRAQVAQLEAEKVRLQEPQQAAARVTAEEQARYGEKQRQQGGPMLPEAKREFFTKLRTDVLKEPTFKLYQDVRNGYQNVRIGAETDSGQGDLAIINGMAKILDPNSTVMSGEARNVETAQGELERWFNSPQRFFEGDRLTPENRQRFLRLAHAMAKEKLTTAQTELKTVYGPLAQEGQIDFEQLVPLPDLKPLGAGPNVEKFDKLFDEK